MKRRLPAAILITCLVTFLTGTLSHARPADSLRTAFPDIYLDTVKIEKIQWVNDYTLIGVNAGVTFSRMQFNPSHRHSTLFHPSYFSVMLTRYGKMFGYMPYFGFQIGFAYGHEGFLFKPNSETGVTYTVDGASKMEMEVVEVPFLAQIHVDSDFVKIMANAGIYGGYRMSVHREGPSLTEAQATTFADTDIRFDYGLQGGVSIGFMFDPLEFHVGALIRYSWSSIYTPDSSNSVYNQYYYRYAYPLDVMVTAGLHFQLTKRKGKTSHDIKREAYDYVYKGKKAEDSPGKDR